MLLAKVAMINPLAPRLVKQGVEGLADFALAHGVAGTLRIGGVAEQGQHSPVAQFRQPGQVDGLPFDGGIVHLKVPGLDDDPGGGMDAHSHASRGWSG